MGKELGKAVRASGCGVSKPPVNERAGGEVKSPRLHAPYGRMVKAAGGSWSQVGHQRSPLAPRMSLPWYPVPHPVLGAHSPRGAWTMCKRGDGFQSTDGFQDVVGPLVTYAP